MEKTITNKMNKKKENKISVHQKSYRDTGMRGLMRGMETLPQGNQELLVVRDKVGRPQVSSG